MKFLLVNKFLYNAGGCENYMLSLGNKLIQLGHKVEYFGVFSSKNTVGNSFNIYVENYDDKKIFNPFSIVYNHKAKKLMKKILNDYKPDIVHMNNISYHLTSSIIDACKEMNVPVVMTIHDPQLVCPNHMLYRFDTKKICNECLEDKTFKQCLKHKCLKGSFLKSYLAYLESNLTHKKRKYDYVSKFICPSMFMKNKLLEGGYEEEKLILLRNFSDFNIESEAKKDDYILYFGRLSEEKGIDILLKALPSNIKLKIAGKGPMEEYIKSIENENIEFVGFKQGQELQNLIAGALFSVYPSKWYENAPLSIFESIKLRTPVIASSSGGACELIEEGKTGLLFENENVEMLKEKIIFLYNDVELRNKMYNNCLEYNIVPNSDKYIEDLLEIYKGCVDYEKIIK